MSTFELPMSTLMKKLLTLQLFFMVCLQGFAQVVYEDINNTGVYDFLDELANLRMITLNSAIKPYSRAYIAAKLHEAKMADTVLDTLRLRFHKLNKRQRKELMFYLQDYQIESQAYFSSQSNCLAGNYHDKISFILKKQPEMVVSLNPLAFQFKDSLFTFSIRPILGMQWSTNENAAEYHRWWGGSMFGYIGKNLGFYANLRDNNASVEMAKPKYFTLEQGQVYKNLENGTVDYSEMRGGIVASAKWGSIGIILDRIEWGDNYHGSNILSGRAPAFPSIQLHLNPVKWFDFSYMHGWLNSTIIDSSRSYYSGNTYRIVYRNKYIAANMFTFVPWKGLNFSFGNSIIYSDINVNPLYLIPFLFYNSADAVKNNYSSDAGSNSQLFFNISSRQIRHLHLFISLFIDEWKMSRVMNPDRHNFTSLKAGLTISDFPVTNLSFTAEYLRTQPMTYDHYIATTTFASGNYVLGNYLRENSQEIFVAASWHPLRGVLLSASYTLSEHGDDIPYAFNAGYEVDNIPFMKNKTWQNASFGLSARYEFVNNGYFFVQYLNSNHQGDVGFLTTTMRGKTNTLNMGINIGF